MLTIAESLQQAALSLRLAGIQNDVLDAQTLLAHTLGQDRTYLIINFKESLPDSTAAQFQTFIQRRATGEPLQYIVGHQQFYGLDFVVNPAVLIPRPETELIVEEVLRLAAKQAAPVIVDVGTGSGCIAVTLARELAGASVMATDISAESLAVAKLNAANHQQGGSIAFHQTDLLNGLQLQADFIVSNPPYIAEEEIPTLQREVRDWEPRSALTDFGDGLQFYRRLLQEAPSYLKAGGYLMFEMGYLQAEKIKALVDRSVWSEPRAILDFQGIARTLVLTKRS